jgi:hypothetical protein
MYPKWLLVFSKYVVCDFTVFITFITFITLITLSVDTNQLFKT